MNKIYMMLSVFSLLSCSEDPFRVKPKEPCEINETGELVLENTTNKDYKLYIDGQYKRMIFSKSYITLVVDSGVLKLDAEEDKYILFQDKKGTLITISPCESKSWTIRK
jgi:hypothetical protein